MLRLVLKSETAVKKSMLYKVQVDQGLSSLWTNKDMY